MRRRGALLIVVAVATSAILQVGPVASAGAAAPDFLLHMPATDTTPGEGAGELSFPGAVAGDPQTGHVFIAEEGNHRISEYTAWGLFVKAWGWGVADGAPELQTCGPPEPQEDPDPALCRRGSIGEAAGQVMFAFGLAVDPDGNVYAHEWLNHRVQKFSPDGEFLLMFGSGVNQGPLHPGDVCTATHVEEGDTCGKGSEGQGTAQLDELGGDHLAYSPAEGGTILVGDKDGIEVFDLSGNHVKRIAFEGPLKDFAGQSVNGLDVDKAGSVYFTLSDLPDVYKLSPAGVPLAPGLPGASSFEVANPLGVAVDAQDNVYTVEFKAGRYVLGYEADGTPIAGMTAGAEFAGGEDLRGLAVNECDGSDGPNLYLARNSTGVSAHSLVEAYGAGPIGCEPPPKRPPDITAQFATAVGREEATVKAQINPLFWPDTTYQVEYGTGPCAMGGCPLKALLSAASLTDKSTNAALTTAGVVLEGLEPQTTYHFRFVAQSSGGGPVFGVDPDGREGPAQASEGEGLEATFTTFRAASKPLACANDAVRIGPAAQLPDCRAYEMVSPLDKGGGDVAQWEGRNGIRPASLETNKSAVDAGRFTYSSFLAFGEAESAPFAAQHLAERGAGGWSSEPISPPRSESPVTVIETFDDEFQGFTESLCRAWVRPYSVAPLAAGAIEGYPNLYRRENCVEPSAYTAVTTEKPLNFSPSEYVDLRTKGFSRDGSHVIFATGGRLENTDAPKVEAGGDLLYEHTAGELRFVCYLPSGNASAQPCSAGGPVNAGIDRASVHNAISEDGSRIFWTAYTVSSSVDARQPGRIFVRIDGKETRPVSTTKASDPAFFWTAAADGSRAIFSFLSGTLEDHLYEVDVDTETPTLIAKGVEGPMGASEDASRVYFASSEDLDAGGPASAGDHNLYLYEAAPGGGGGEITFIMELGDEDVSPLPQLADPAMKPVDFVPSKRAARVSPDGLHATFMSLASPTPTGYDNRDAASGDPLAEVYLYDAAEERLRCVSCHPAGARPAGDGGLAAQIQGWEQRNNAPRVLSDDGTRVFFESFEVLVPRDTNGTWDVYQWEEAGKGTCTSASETFAEDSGGCVDLISAGTSSSKSTFLDADPSGENIFFSTQSSLVGADYGLNDVYVARVGGGFPEVKPTAPCAGEACQSPPPPPPEVTPSTRTAAGPGNVRKRCPKGKRRVKRAGKVKCVKRKKAKGKGTKAKARKTRRAGR